MTESAPGRRPGPLPSARSPADERPAPLRLEFPTDEARHPWLAPLLDAYHLIDQGVHQALGRALRRGRRLACAKGCAACCRSHLTIPVYPLELVGFYWYLSEQLDPALLVVLRGQLSAHRPGSPCPFLVEEVCAIHPLRPAACRQFNVLDRVCAEGEDAFYTRRADVVTPIQRFADAAFERMLPFYGVTDPAERRAAIREGRVHALAKVLQDLDWGKLAARLGDADPGRSDPPIGAGSRP